MNATTRQIPLTPNIAARLLADKRTVTSAERAYNGPYAVACACGSRAPHDHER